MTSQPETTNDGPPPPYKTLEYPPPTYHQATLRDRSPRCNRIEQIRESIRTTRMVREARIQIHRHTAVYTERRDVRREPEPVVVKWWGIRRWRRLACQWLWICVCLGLVGAFSVALVRGWLWK